MTVASSTWGQFKKWIKATFPPKDKKDIENWDFIMVF